MGTEPILCACILLSLLLLFLPPATKLRQGNVFTRVCDSVDRGGGSVPACLTRSHDHGGLCPGGGGLCPEGVSVRRGISVQGGSLLGRIPPYGNERAVSILLECFFVF